ncbi:MAG: aconitate hydratase AcnA, partial [Myxococcales bacterium]|nr:aconitate hydratase AcnA [Myxococcales bacterium]
PGLATMPLANRATIANMAPEYGATLGFFPVDENTLRYMHLSGRDEALIETVERYCKENAFWREDDNPIVYSSDLELDMSSVEPSLSGPKRPQDRIALSAMRPNWHDSLGEAFEKPEVAAAQRKGADEPSVSVHYDGADFALKNGAVCIAAITSCTNTSNPDVMLAAGLVARKAARLGLTRKPWVKTSLAPGSKVVTEYYKAAGLIQDLEALGFHNVGYGCTTCIGNSGPLPEPISKAINEHDLVVCSVLSGNRNFEGRIGPDIQANYLASPPLVVAYAIAGTVNIDLHNDPLGKSSSGEDVFLRDIWPSQDEVDELVASSLSREQFTQQYASVFDGSAEWQRVAAPIGKLYAWDDDSTYVQEPPFFVDLTPEVRPIATIQGARVLCKLGDSVTTDHISPAGSIAPGTPAARYLDSHGVARPMYNSLGARRGNDRVMTRATFGNIRVKNQLAPGTEGGFTVDFSGRETPEGASPLPDEAPKTGVAGRPVRFIYDAVQNYKDAGIPLVVLAGTDYGMGSSRDWAAKGTFLLNVKAVIAKSFERIHRSNLVGMGVLPLCFIEGEGHEELGLDGSETFEIPLDDGLEPRQKVAVHATHPETGKVTRFDTVCRIDTPVEVEYYRNGGILHTVLRKMAAS